MEEVRVAGTVLFLEYILYMYHIIISNYTDDKAKGGHQRRKRLKLQSHLIKKNIKNKKNKKDDILISIKTDLQTRVVHVHSR